MQSKEINKQCQNCTYTCKQYNIGEIMSCQKIKDDNKKKKGLTR